MGIKDQLQVDYVLQNAQQIESLSPPNYTDFNIVGGPYQSSQSNIQMMGNRMVESKTITISYVLQPKHLGTCTVLGAIAKDAANHTYVSNAVSVQVVNGSLAQQRSSSRDPFGDDDQDPWAMMRQQMQQMQQLFSGRGRQQAPPSNQSAEEIKAPADLNKDVFIKVSVDKSILEAHLFSNSSNSINRSTSNFLLSNGLKRVSSNMRSERYSSMMLSP